LPPQTSRTERFIPARRSLSRFCSGGPSCPSLGHTFLCPCFFSTIPYGIRTCEKHAGKPCRIRTSKTQYLKSFRIRSYEKTGEGVPPLVISSVPRPYSLRGTAQAIQPSFRGGTGTMDPARNHWYIACNTEGLTSSISATPAAQADSQCVPMSSLSLTNYKTKASKSCSRD
jgi:hypothetical protein